MPNADQTAVIDAINKYKLWRLVTTSVGEFSFEAWVNAVEDKDGMFASLKPLVDLYGGSIDWHVCTHDETSPQPCVIADTYRAG